MNLPQVLVTGATGMVGSNLIRHLVDRGYNVTALVRPASKISQLSVIKGAGKLDIAVSQLSDARSLQQAMSDHDVVVHTAGTVDPFGKRKDIFAVNVGLTRCVLQAAINAGIKQFIHISSLSVITGQRDQYNVNEEEPLRYCSEAYADSKVDAEKMLMSEHLQGRIHITVLRPGFIYGAGERSWMPRLIASLSSGKAVLIDGGGKECNVIYIGNLCRAIESSLMNEHTYGKVYNLTDGQKVTKKQLFNTICDELKLPRVSRSIPCPVARLACEIVSTVAPLLPAAAQRKLSPFSRAAFRLAGVNQSVNLSNAEIDLHYTDRIPFKAGMAETLKQFAPTGARPAEVVRS